MLEDFPLLNSSTGYNAIRKALCKWLSESKAQDAAVKGNGRKKKHSGKERMER